MSFFLFNHLPWLYNYRGRPRYLRSTRIYPEPGLSSSSISLASNPAFRIWLVFAGVHRSLLPRCSSFPLSFSLAGVRKLIDSKSMLQIRSWFAYKPGEKCSRIFSPRGEGEGEGDYLGLVARVPRARCTGAALQVLQVPGNGGTSQSPEVAHVRVVP